MVRPLPNPTDLPHAPLFFFQDRFTDREVPDDADTNTGDAEPKGFSYIHLLLQPLPCHML